MAFEHLYEWVVVDTNDNATDISCYLELEKRLMQYGIRTRVLPNDQGRGYCLWVPMKDYEVSHALIIGSVKVIIDKPREIYHVFEDNLTFKNEKMYKNPYQNIFKFNKFRSYLIMGFGIVMVIIVFLFVKFS